MRPSKVGTNQNILDYLNDGYNYYKTYAQTYLLVPLLERSPLSYAYNKEKTYLIIHATKRIFILKKINATWDLLRVYHLKKDEEILNPKAKKRKFEEKDLGKTQTWDIKPLKISFNKDSSCFAVTDEDEKIRVFSLEDDTSKQCLPYYAQLSNNK